MTKGKTIQRKVVHAQDVILQNTHSSFLFKLKQASGYQCIKSVFITFKNQTKIGPKTPSLPDCRLPFSPSSFQTHLLSAKY